MTEIAYLIREDWANHGRGMALNAARVHDWLAGRTHFVAVEDLKKIEGDDETIEYISPRGTRKTMVTLEDIRNNMPSLGQINVPVLVMHPYLDRDLDTLRSAVAENWLTHIFVMVSAPSDPVRHWLDGLGATNLFTGTACSAPSPLMQQAAHTIVNEEYNGLGSGRGKDITIQSLRAMKDAGHPLGTTAWARALFAAGASFESVATVTKFIKEMNGGTRHRIKPALRANIVEIWQKEIDAAASAPTA